MLLSDTYSFLNPKIPIVKEIHSSLTPKRHIHYLPNLTVRQLTP